MRPLSRWSEEVYAVFRIVLGLLFLMHGTQKLLGWPPGGHGSPPSGSLMWFGGVIELVCGFLVLVGLFAGIAAFLASGEMAVAYFMVHQPKGALPIQNEGELAVAYCFAFLLVSAKGSGVWSIDAAMHRTRSAHASAPARPSRPPA
jgi:putative oxidoreductase